MGHLHSTKTLELGTWGQWQTCTECSLSHLHSTKILERGMSHWQKVMYEMFYGAWAFNQDIGAWNVGSVTNMAFMFYYASAFNQNLCAWRNEIPYGINSVTNMFSNSRCNYKSTPTDPTNGPFCAVNTCPASASPSSRPTGDQE